MRTAIALAGIGLAGCSGTVSGGGPGGQGDGGASSCPAPPSGISEQARAAFDAANGPRVKMGIPCSAMISELNASSQHHCVYYSANSGSCIADPHSEVASCAMYYGRTFADRMRTAGYKGNPVSEDMAFMANGAGAVRAWIDSVWHRPPVLSPWIREHGYGQAPRCDTMDVGRGEATPDDVIATYPWDGQTDVPTSFSGREGPAPPAPPGGWPSGYVITFFMKGSVTEHVLTVDGSATPIEHIWLYPGSPQLPFAGVLDNGFVMYPHTPLAAATRYRVRIVGDNGAAVTREWTFTTRS